MSGNSGDGATALPTDQEVRAQYLWLLFAERTFNYERSIQMICEMLSTATYGRLLELGCGTGSLLAQLESKGYQCTGLDMDPARIELARRLNEQRQGRCTFVHSTAGNYRPSEMFDAAIWMNVPLSFGVLTEEFLPCITRSVRRRGRALFDYLTPQNGHPKGRKQWVDDLDFAGNDLLPQGHYQRTVTMNFDSSPWSVHWVGRRLRGTQHETVFEYSVSLPTLDASALRAAYRKQGWVHAKEVLAEPIAIENEGVGFRFVVDLFERGGEG